MHLLATTSGVVDGGATAIDLKQSPGDVVFLSAADSELASLASAIDAETSGLTFRLANLLQLQHNYSVDLYTEQTLSKAKLIVVRLLGGKAYWPYGVARLVELAAETGVKLVLLPGGTDGDAELKTLSTVLPEQWDTCNWRARERPKSRQIRCLVTEYRRKASGRFSLRIMFLPLYVTPAKAGA
jgi:cobaltochelatase CobN